MRHLKIKHIAVLLLFASISVKSQQLPQITQYLLNPFLVNPAFAGNEEYPVFNVTSRQQWLGMPNAPTTNSISVQTRLLKRKKKVKYSTGKGVSKLLDTRSGKVGLGLNLFADKTAYIKNTSLMLAYSYHIKMRQSELVFGLAGSVIQLSTINQSNLNLHTQNDPSVNGMGVTMYTPDASVGVSYKRQNLTMGLSVMQLFQTPFKIGTDYLGNYQVKRHYYVIGMYKYNISKSYVLEPSIMFKTSEQLLPQTDFTMRFLCENNYWVGLSYRTDNSYIAMAGIRILKLYVGYAYEYSSNELSSYNYGSHELMLMVKLDKSKNWFKGKYKKDSPVMIAN